MEETHEQVMPLDVALAYIQVHNLFLVRDEHIGLDLWTCGRKVPLSLRRSLFQHREQLLDMMQSGDSRVCPSPEIHRRSWRKKSGICKLCEKFSRSMQEGKRSPIQDVA
jgi:hypothetical protein